MNEVTGISEPASELERLIAELSESGPLVFVFGDGFTAAHLKGVTTPLFRGPGRPALVACPARRRRGELDDGRAGR